LTILDKKPPDYGFSTEEDVKEGCFDAENKI